MSVLTAALRELVAAGLSGDALVAAFGRIEEASAPPLPTPRQARNRRYYERLKASEIKTPKTQKERSPTPPKEKLPPNPSPSASGLDPTRQAFELWNETAGRCGLSKAKDLTAARRRAIAARLAEHGEDGWREALAAVEASEFCRGGRTDRDGRSFRADLDFVCQPRSFQRLREGFYGSGAKTETDTSDWPELRWQLAVTRWRRDGHWPDSWGPPPGQPGCRCPASLYVTEAQRVSA